MKTLSRMLCGALLGSLASPIATAGDNLDEYRLTLFPTYRINEDWTGIGYLGYVTTPESDTVVNYLGTGGIRRLSNKWDMWNVLIWTRTAVAGETTIREFRPVVGFQYALDPWGRVKPFNLFRVEYRIVDRVDAGSTDYFRLRNRLGMTFPIGQGKGKGSFYGLADAEIFYRTDKHLSDLARLRAGVGYVASERVRLEFIAHAQFRRADADSAFGWTDNIFRLNIKVARDDGLLERLVGGDSDAD